MAFRFLWDNKIDSATLAASSEASGYPIENIQDEWYDVEWRSTGLTAEYIAANLGAVEEIKAFFVYFHNLRIGADVRIQADNDPAYGSLNVNDLIPITQDMIDYSMMGKFFDSAKDFRYWRELISDDDSGHPDGFILNGRVFLGDYFEPQYMPSITPSVTDVEPSEILESLNGKRQVNEKDRYERITYTWDVLPISDIVKIREMFAAVKRKPIFICEDSDDPIPNMKYARIVGEISYGPVVYGYRSVQITVESEV